jgi:hypothetical protein
MAYNYTNGDGKAVLLSAEPANSDSVAASCAQAIRQIKAWIRDATDAGAATKAEANSAAAAAQAAAIGAIVAGKNIFRAKPAADIDIVHGGAGIINTDITLGTEVFDPDNNFATNIFTVPVTGYYQFMASITAFLQAGAPTYITVDSYITASDGQVIKLSNPYDDLSAAQRTMAGSGIFYLQANDTVKLNVSTELDAAGTVRIAEITTFLSGCRLR